MFNFKVCGFAAGFAFVISFLMGILSRSAMPALIVRPLLFAVVFFVFAGLIYMVAGRFLPEIFESSDSGFGNDVTTIGANINISEGDFSQGGAQPPVPGGSPVVSSVPVTNAALADEYEGSIGDISSFDTVSPGAAAGQGSPDTESPNAHLDQNEGDGYNTSGGLGALSLGFEAIPVEKKTQSADASADVPADEPQAEPIVPADSFSAMFDGIKGLPDASGEVLPDLDSLAKRFSSDSGGGEEEDDYSGSSGRKKSSSRKEPVMDKDYSPKDLAEGIRTIIKKEG